MFNDQCIRNSGIFSADYLIKKKDDMVHCILIFFVVFFFLHLNYYEKKKKKSFINYCVRELIEKKIFQ